MAVKFLYYFLIAFVFIALFLLYKKPFVIELAKVDKSEASMKMLGITSYSIVNSGIEHIIKGTKVLRFTNRDEFYDIDAVRKSNEGLLENLRADSGVLVGDNLSLKGNVRYENSNSVRFRSEQADYNLKLKVFKTDSDFVLEDNRSITKGASMIYMTKEEKIYAKKIRSKIEVNKK